MASKSPLVVVDTCVYVDVLYYGQDPKGTMSDRSERSKNILSLIEQKGWRAGVAPVVRVELNSSTQLGGHHPQATRFARRKALDEYFGSTRHILLENDERVTRLAASLARECELKAPDALIAASAVSYGAHYLYSWDADMLKLDNHHLMRSTRVVSPPAICSGDPPVALSSVAPVPMAPMGADSQQSLFVDEIINE